VVLFGAAAGIASRVVALEVALLADRAAQLGRSAGGA
jgi:hypothetical protein